MHIVPFVPFVKGRLVRNGIWTRRDAKQSSAGTVAVEPRAGVSQVFVTEDQVIAGSVLDFTGRGHDCGQSRPPTVTVGARQALPLRLRQ